MILGNCAICPHMFHPIIFFLMNTGYRTVMCINSGFQILCKQSLSQFAKFFIFMSHELFQYVRFVNDFFFIITHGRKIASKSFYCNSFLQDFRKLCNMSTHITPNFHFFSHKHWLQLRNLYKYWFSNSSQTVAFMACKVFRLHKS